MYHQNLLALLKTVNVQRRICMPLRLDIGDFPVPPPTYTTSIGARFFSSGSSSEMIQLLFNISQLTAVQTKFKQHTTQSWK